MALLILNSAEGLVQMVIAARPGPAGRAGRASGQDLAKTAREADDGAPGPDFRVLCAQTWHAPSQGAELLAPALADALRRLGLKPAQIRHIACVRGPGGFTGLRLALASASGLASATGAALAGIDYLPLLAANAAARLAPFSAPGDSIWAATHARRNLVHLQGFDFAPAGSGPPAPRSDLLVLEPSLAAELIEKERGKGRALLLGSGLVENSAVFSRQGFLPLPGEYAHPDSGALLGAAIALEYRHKDLIPLYARPSDAEDNIRNIASSLNLDPDEARDRLSELTGGA